MMKTFWISAMVFFQMLHAGMKEECVAGDLDACYRLAVQIGKDGDRQTSREILESVCERNYRKACDALWELKSNSNRRARVLADSGDPVSWKGHYENRRYGIAFDYPENVFTHKTIIPPGPDHGEEIKLKGRGGMGLYVYSAVYDQRINEVYNDIVRVLGEDGSVVTDKSLQRSRYFIKGVKNDGRTAFYKQAFFQDNIGIYMDFQYPVDVQERYEPLVRQIVQRAHMTFPARDTSTDLAASVVENRGPVLLYRDRRSYHLGDERIRRQAWARLHGRCLSFSFTGGGYRSYLLSMEKYGVESAVLYLNGQRLGYLPRQQSRRGKRRSNYWSRREALRIPGNYVQGGSNRLRICSAPVANPEFPGDVDDMQIRDIQLFGE